MKEFAERIQVVMNTIQDIDIKSTFDNMNRIMGALQALAAIRDELNNMDEARNDHGRNDNGNTDAE